MSDILDVIKGRLEKAKAELDKQPHSASVLYLDGRLDNPDIAMHHVKLHERAASMADSNESRAYHRDQASQIMDHISGKKKFEMPTHVIKNDDIDKKIAEKMRAEMDKRGMGGKQIADHHRDIDESIPAKQRANIKTSLANQKKPKLSVVRAEECLKFDSNGQWSLVEKSNYGPKGYGLYNPADNAERKAKNTGESVEHAGKNVNVKSYTTTGSSMGAAASAAEAKRQAAANKVAPVRTMKDMSDEEKQEIVARYNKEKV